MTRKTRVLAFVFGCVSLAFASTPLSAQWLKYPTARVPKLPNGRPNLNAPTPRTSDGKPDFSGLWEPERNRTCPPEGCFDMLAGEQFFNIGWGLKDGLPYRPWAADARKTRMAENGKDDPVSYCLPGGVVKQHTTPLLEEATLHLFFWREL